jgi:hypothetical protein
MANIKKISLLLNEEGATIYCIIRRDADNYYLDDSNGNFTISPIDKYILLTEDIIVKGNYELSESRKVWDGGSYSVYIYQQVCASPNPDDDSLVGSGIMDIVDDIEVTLASIQTEVNVNTTQLQKIKEKTDLINAGGELTWTYTLTNSATGDPIEGATIRLTSDAAGDHTLRTATTNALGVATFYFSDADAGMTVYVWRYHAGFTGTNPDTEVIS